MIVVQELQTWWTKQSGGSPAADARNRTPRALVAPVTPEPLSTIVLHRVRFDESRAFAPAVLDAPPRGVSAGHPAACISLREDGLHGLVVAFVWDFLLCGAPRRPSGTPIHLREGDWCQVLHNGRHGSDREWSYQSTVVNVAVLTKPIPSVFLDSKPVAISNHLADLG